MATTASITLTSDDTIRAFQITQTEALILFRNEAHQPLALSRKVRDQLNPCAMRENPEDVFVMKR